MTLGTPCVSDSELAAGGVVSGLDECIAYFDDHVDPCVAPAHDDPIKLACTWDAVSSWRLPSETDPCERWKLAAMDRAFCDGEVFWLFSPDIECVTDEELAATGGPFSTVRECADCLLEYAWPCAIPLGESRYACSPDVILRIP